MYFTPNIVFTFLYDFYQVLIRDAPGIYEKDENRSKSTKVTKVTIIVTKISDAVRIGGNCFGLQL